MPVRIEKWQLVSDWTSMLDRRAGSLFNRIRRRENGWSTNSSIHARAENYNRKMVFTLTRNYP